MKMKIDKDIFIAYEKIKKIYKICRKDCIVGIQRKELEKLFIKDLFLLYILSLFYYDKTLICFSEFIHIFKVIFRMRYPELEWYGAIFDWKKRIINFRSEINLKLI